MENTTYKAKRFLLPILSLVLISIITISIINSYITINVFTQHMEEQIINTKNKYTQEHKNRVYNDVMYVNESIKFQISQIEEILKASLKEKIETAHSVATFIYNQYKNTHTKEEIKEKIAQALAHIKFYDKRGYYFMYDNKTKVIFGHPMRKFVGKDMTHFTDARGRNLMQTDAEILKNSKIGFNKIYFNKPDNHSVEFPKITCITKFEPLDIVLGIGEYLDIIENQTKTFVLNRFNYGQLNRDDKYIVVLNVHDLNGGDEFATVLLNSNKPELVGQKVSDKDKDIKGNEFRKTLLNLIKEKGEGYVTYWYKKPSTNLPALKMSYVYFQKDWNWIIISGFYYEDLEKQIAQMKKSITSHTNKTISQSIFWVILLSLIAIIIAIFVSIKIDKTIKLYANTIIEYEEKKRKQEQMLIQQSKMAALGEMLENIAHQWRQPLSVISTASTGVMVQKSLHCLSDTQLDSALTAINDSAQYLSNTIEDFRNFFRPSNSKISEFNIKNTIEKTLNLLTSTFVAKDIELVQDIEDFKLKSIENELIQVLINILNNARDALVELKNEKRIILLKAYKKDHTALIEIQDSGKGIPNNIIKKVFEPYFTTKHKSKGTGIGLFMSEEIIRVHMKGTLTVSNEEFIYKNISYIGAKFTIAIKTS